MVWQKSVSIFKGALDSQPNSLIAINTTFSLSLIKIESALIKPFGVSQCMIILGSTMISETLQAGILQFNKMGFGLDVGFVKISFDNY
ncbi:MAG: hypothetical protein IPN86_04570 [Saprospiraceae bacterium]|nr:hypothetical protein [Saprospiraceae bacterium]